MNLSFYFGFEVVILVKFSVVFKHIRIEAWSGVGSVVCCRFYPLCELSLSLDLLYGLNSSLLILYASLKMQEVDPKLGQSSSIAKHFDSYCRSDLGQVGFVFHVDK